ncbi:2Fe-2S iron-sulfur cluster-binding protein [Hydrogenophaga luteola]|uniref:2Fe-2S iron-sulfur cluster-binding protein n=1 Tax=Hydrogenophaga luteola TaxID=1591122 RepID=A0ABV7W169_9BURK
MPTEDIPRRWVLDLPEQGLRLQAPEQRTLLQTLQAAGVPWPASCRNGTCRTCIGRLTAGQVRYGVDWPGLLPEEKTSGAVLPCVAYPLSDVKLEGPGD